MLLIASVRLRNWRMSQALSRSCGCLTIKSLHWTVSQASSSSQLCISPTILLNPGMNSINWYASRWCSTLFSSHLVLCDLYHFSTNRGFFPFLHYSFLHLDVLLLVGSYLPPSFLISFLSAAAAISVYPTALLFPYRGKDVAAVAVAVTSL
jgi:hypothetical protein